MKLTLVIPVYNEEKRLLPSLQEIDAWLRRQKFSWEVIIANDGSRDATLTKIQSFLDKNSNYQVVSYQNNRGKGRAVKKGMRKAAGEIIFFTDADLSVSTDQFAGLINALEKGAQVAVGSRFVPGAKILVAQNPFRRRMSQLYYLLVRLLLFRGPTDTQCGFKAFTAPAAKKIFRRVKLDSGLFDLEIFLLAKRFGYQIAEIPVAWKHHPDSRFKFALGESVGVVRDLLTVKLLYKIFFPVEIKTEIHSKI